MLVVVRLVNAADVQMSWPSCATSRLSVLLSGTQLGALTPYEALGSPFYQPVATFVGSVCGTTPGTYCLTPNNTPNANTYATVATRFVVSGTANAPAPGTLVTARFSAQFLDHTDNYNEYVYGLQLWTFLGDYTPLGSEPKGATFSLSTGSLLGNFKYPDWDVITPMALVFPLNTSHVCDSLIMFNENSSTPCKFYNDTPFTSALRWPRFDVEVVFNMTGVSNYLVSAIVRYNGSNMLFNLTNLQPHWTAIPATPDGNNQVFGFISARSSVELSNISVTATLNCPPTTKSTTSLTATTVVPTSTTVVQTSSSSSSTSPPGVPVTPITSTLTSGSLTSTESSNATNPDNPTINLRANDNTRSRNATDDTALFTALFVTFAVICCCVLMCTLFRKRIRRSRPMKALYFSTPKPLRAALCMLCIKIDHETGATYEEGKLTSRFSSFCDSCARVCVRSFVYDITQRTHLLTYHTHHMHHHHHRRRPLDIHQYHHTCNTLRHA